jgi:hypothetical protein
MDSHGFLQCCKERVTEGNQADRTRESGKTLGLGAWSGGRVARAPSVTAMDGFVMERYWPGVTAADVWSAGTALTAVSSDDARYLGSILMPGDEVVLFGFDAVSADRVSEVSEQAGLRCDRVVPAVFTDLPGRPG